MPEIKKLNYFKLNWNINKKLMIQLEELRISKLKLIQIFKIKSLTNNLDVELSKNN
jgi:hypothetical protein